jgi:hypothetical protein
MGIFDRFEGLVEELANEITFNMKRDDIITYRHEMQNRLEEELELISEEVELSPDFFSLIDNLELESESVLSSEELLYNTKSVKEDLLFLVEDTKESAMFESLTLSGY